jgi:hypothetical protein
MTCKEQGVTYIKVINRHFLGGSEDSQEMFALRQSEPHTFSCES